MAARGSPARRGMDPLTGRLTDLDRRTRAGERRRGRRRRPATAATEPAAAAPSVPAVVATTVTTGTDGSATWALPEVLDLPTRPAGDPTGGGPPAVPTAAGGTTAAASGGPARTADAAAPAVPATGPDGSEPGRNDLLPPVVTATVVDPQPQPTTVYVAAVEHVTAAEVTVRVWRHSPGELAYAPAGTVVHLTAAAPPRPPRRIDSQ